jgi:cell division protein FtsZ
LATPTDEAAASIPAATTSDKEVLSLQPTPVFVSPIIEAATPVMVNDLPETKPNPEEMKAALPEMIAETSTASAPVFLEITPAYEVPAMLHLPVVENRPEDAAIPPTSVAVKDASAPASSAGGYLAKPVNIYAQEQPLTSESNTTEELTTRQSKLQDDEPVEEMQLVVKDSHQAAEETPAQTVQQTQPIMMHSIEEPAMQDEMEELRRRAAERIAKLRNLSFNINAADPNNEFENVPAYLRRNMELHSSIADVESFYSNYTVKNDENNQPEISTINSFLDGKKPD